MPSQLGTLTELQGYTGLEYPPQRRPRISRCHRTAITHQYRIHSRVRRHYLPHNRLPRVLVYDHHWVHINETHS